MISVNIELLATISAFAIYTVIVGILLARILILKKLAGSLANEALANMTEVEMLKDRIGQLVLSASDEANENFIKFLSDSRDWAFSYIEETQAIILEYKAATILGDDLAISAAQEKLFSMLPDDSVAKD